MTSKVTEKKKFKRESIGVKKTPKNKTTTEQFTFRKSRAGYI